MISNMLSERGWNVLHIDEDFRISKEHADGIGKVITPETVSLLRNFPIATFHAYRPTFLEPLLPLLK